MRKLPAEETRVETGALQFGDDWPGVFIRGDNAGYYAMLLKSIIERSGDARTTFDAIAFLQLGSLYDDLRSCVVGPALSLLPPSRALQAQATAPMQRYKADFITVSGRPTSSLDHYRITDTESDSRIATCYEQEHAEVICSALNLMHALRRSG